MLSASTSQRYAAPAAPAALAASPIDAYQAPIPESFRRPLNNPDFASSQFRTSQGPDHIPDVEATFLTTDTSFVEHPPSSKMATKFQNPVTPAPAEKKPTRGRGGGIPRAGGRGGIPTRGGATRGTRGASGIARGVGRGRAARGST